MEKTIWQEKIILAPDSILTDCQKHQCSKFVSLNDEKTASEVQPLPLLGTFDTMKDFTFFQTAGRSGFFFSNSIL